MGSPAMVINWHHELEYGMFCRAAARPLNIAAISMGTHRSATSPIGCYLCRDLSPEVGCGPRLPSAASELPSKHLSQPRSPVLTHRPARSPWHGATSG